MTRLQICMTALLLAGCAQKAARVPPISVVYREPLAGVDLPVPPSPLGPRPAATAQALDTALAQLCRSYAYIVAADPLLRLSAGLEARAPLAYPECQKD